MKKVLKILIVVIILCSNYISYGYDESYEEWDYVWIAEAIEEAKQEQEPIIYSKSAVIYDRSSKTILWGKNENEKVPMASTTKIMTAIVMLEKLGDKNLNKEVIVCKEAANMGGSRLGLHTNDKITYNDLLYGLMLCSGNDAATQIAISIAGSIEEFAELMNNKAKELNLENTHFLTPHGLDQDGHYTTAVELAKITDYALNIPKIAEAVKQKEYSITINGYKKVITNTNELLGNLEGVNGVKTGFTNLAGRCLVTSVNRNGFEIITIVLGADTKKIRTKDSIKLIEYAYKNYKLINIEELVLEEYTSWCEINENRIKINKGIKEEVQSYIEKIKYINFPIKDNDIIIIESIVNTEFEAPLKANTEIGKITIKKNDDIIDEILIKTKNVIRKKQPKDYIYEIIQLLKQII